VEFLQKRGQGEIRFAENAVFLLTRRYIPRCRRHWNGAIKADRSLWKRYPSRTHPAQYSAFLLSASPGCRNAPVPSSAADEVSSSCRIPNMRERQDCGYSLPRALHPDIRWDGCAQTLHASSFGNLIESAGSQDGPKPVAGRLQPA